MKQLKFLFLSSLIFVLLPFQSIAQKLVTDNVIVPLQKTNGNPQYTVMNINNLTMSVRRDGILGRVEYGYGIKYPKETAEVIYADGILYGGIVYDGKVVNFSGNDYLIRLQGSTYGTGLLSGRIIEKGITEDPDDPDVRIWRIRRDWQTADLTEDAAEFYKIPKDRVSQEQIDSLKIQYEKDWREWPWQKGAPFYDSNENGILDNGEEPGNANADQVIWYVANDTYSDGYFSKDTYSDAYFFSPPFGMEMQITLWAYNRKSSVINNSLSKLNDALQHIIFKRVRLIYKGCIDTPDTAHIDSMYIGQWSDPDVGYSWDDLVGCDTTLSLGYAYNSNSFDRKFFDYKLSPPALGYAIIQGPIIPSRGDFASFNMRKKVDYKNLSMTAFTYWSWRYGVVSDPYNPNYFNTTLRYYKMLKGFAGLIGIQVYFLHPPGKTPGPFPLAGDPVNSVGHIDGLGKGWSPYPGDRRFICSSGLFTMALGDTQEVIIAIVGGLGADRLASISVMKYNARLAHILAENNFTIGFKEEVIPEPEPIPQDYFIFQNYPNPFNASTEIHYNLPVKRMVKLAIYNLLGQTVKVLTDGIQEARSYAIKWDGTNILGEPVPAGLYLYRLEAGSVVFTKKLILLR